MRKLSKEMIADYHHKESWVDADGNHPPEWTIINVSDVEQGVWRPKNKADTNMLIAFIRSNHSRKNQLPFPVG